jgi:UDP-N-acetylmuramyl pentapeptide phosphotransferase/UDP-N-acetylglucosamine-1-phosphate transferase
MTFFELTLVAAVSLGVALLTVLTQPWHQRWTADFESSGVQKQHKGSPPRVGVLALLAGLMTAWLMLSRSAEPGLAEAARALGLLLLCAVPVVALGFAEDVTKRVRVRWRMLGALASAGLAMVLMGHLIPGVGSPLLDPLFTWLPLSVAFTAMMVAGFTNAMNIVDGLNGLAGGLALLMCGATAVAAAGAQDMLVVLLCALLAMAVLGFLLVNFPRGLIFLGDGGAYLIGFLMAQIWLLLLLRNPGEISPWFPVAVAFHPTMETAFSMARRKFRPRGHRSATTADRLHMHTLIYRRVTRPLIARHAWVQPWTANSLAALGMLVLAALPAAAVLLNPASTAWTLTVIGVSALGFVWHFTRLVRFSGTLRRRVLPPTAEVAG